MLNLVAELDEFKGRWESFGRLGSDVLDRLNILHTIRWNGYLKKTKMIIIGPYALLNTISEPMGKIFKTGFNFFCTV